MNRFILFILILLSVLLLQAQPNCEAFKYYGDDLKYEACKTAEKRRGHYQFSRKYQEALDEALQIDSTFAYAYRAKSVAYLKAGDFITWKALMDKAVGLDPLGYLEYRGWCRYQFFRDYEGAIADIERLDDLTEQNIGFSVNADYHLHIARALCYKALGQPLKAIQIIEQQLQEPSHFMGLYDHLHLGVLYLETNQFKKAIDTLLKQQDENDLAENRYYLALAYKATNQPKEYLRHLLAAQKKYANGARMFDPYVEQMDKIYRVDITNEMQSEFYRVGAKSSK